jgi:hypothetical protein
LYSNKDSGRVLDLGIIELLVLMLVVVGNDGVDIGA